MVLTNFEKITQYYSEALYAIQKSNYKEAVDILYNKMPTELYDTSLDILYNRNLNVSKDFNELKDLIRIVDDKLVKYSTNKESDEYDEDKFIGDIF